MKLLLLILIAATQGRYLMQESNVNFHPLTEVHDEAPIRTAILRVLPFHRSPLLPHTLLRKRNLQQNWHRLKRMI